MGSCKRKYRVRPAKKPSLGKYELDKEKKEISQEEKIVKSLILIYISNNNNVLIV